MKNIKLDASKVSKVATKASVDIRTVLRAAEGLPVREMALTRIMKALAALGLGLALLVGGCDPGDGLTVGQTTDAQPVATCTTWGPVINEGTFDGIQICRDGAPVPPWTQLSGPCACQDGTLAGGYSLNDGIWYCLCVQPSS
jgi:hypothetical protein